MIILQCDRCKKDCELWALDITMQVIHNPTPIRGDEVGFAEITHDRTVKRFFLCSDCVRKLGLPNIYENGLTFRDTAREGRDDYEADSEDDQQDNDASVRLS